MGEYDRAGGERVPGGGRRVTEVGRCHVGMFAHVIVPPRGLGPKPVRVDAGDRHGDRARGRRAGRGLPDRLHPGRGHRDACGLRLRKHHMAIGPTHPERTHPGDQGLVRAGPLALRRLHPQAQFVQRDPRMGFGEVQAGREPPVSDRQHRLEQADDAGRALQVPDVGLHRTDGQRRPVRPFGAERRTECGGLDRVADGGAGAVQFDVLDGGRGDPGPPSGQPDHLRLGPGVGRGQRLAAPVVVHRAAPDHAVHDVAVGQRPGQRLEHHHRTALAAHVAVGPGVEGEAAALRGESAELGRVAVAVGNQVQVDPADQGQGRLAAAQALAGQVYRDQGRGLGGVHRHAGAAQTEGVRDPVGDHAAVQAGGMSGAGFDAGAAQQGGVVVPDRGGEHPGGAAPDPGRRDARVFQRLPAQFEHQALLRVDQARLARGDAEEGGVEPVHRVQESASSRSVRDWVGGSAGRAARVVRRSRVPAVAGHLCDRVASAAQQVPELVGAVGAGEPAGQPDDGHRVFRRGVSGMGIGAEHSHSALHELHTLSTRANTDQHIGVPGRSHARGEFRPGPGAFDHPVEPFGSLGVGRERPAHARPRPASSTREDP
ncbi:hypothetical protein EHYA_05616 [Embleya hyalina]|uniref:Uncharacterized protein n=1 Tax=Embleya hyalina TaxID=516124 RepID=A0A401YTL6_9ACTN|nr:hypothetical protein EHYA_05616 [Embleya hyalina]